MLVITSLARSLRLQGNAIRAGATELIDRLLWADERLRVERDKAAQPVGMAESKSKRTSWQKPANRGLLFSVMSAVACLNNVDTGSLVGRRQPRAYSITSSVWASSVGGMLRPRA